jgi:hypothetical protein
MALYYQTEYRIGGRGRVRRSYRGFRAFLAIFLDLIFGLLFELVTGVTGLVVRLAFAVVQFGWSLICLSWKTLVALMAAIVFVATLPFVALNHAVVRLRSRASAPEFASESSGRKPHWAFGREV